MCLKPKASALPPRPTPPPPVQPAPTRVQIAADTAKKSKKEAIDRVRVSQEQAVLTQERQGVMNNILTSRQGDARYGRYARVGVGGVVRRA